MGRQDQNGTPRTRKRRPRVMKPRSPRWLHVPSRPKCPPKTWKRHPRIMEPPRPLWPHGSPGAKWHPKDSEDVNPEQLEQGWMKALRRLSIWDCSLRLMWTWNSQLASKGLKSYAITMYGRPIGYRRNDNHQFQVQTDIPRF